jgi:hypothetical protein
MKLKASPAGWDEVSLMLTGKEMKGVEQSIQVRLKVYADKGGRQCYSVVQLTIATITINEGMKWRSKPAPGAPLGQLDAQNLPKLDISESALLFSGCNLECPMDCRTFKSEGSLDDIHTAEHPPLPTLGLLGIGRK